MKTWNILRSLGVKEGDTEWRSCAPRNWLKLGVKEGDTKRRNCAPPWNWLKLRSWEMGLRPRTLRRMEKKQKSPWGQLFRPDMDTLSVRSWVRSYPSLALNPDGPILLGVKLAQVWTGRLCSVQPSPPLWSRFLSLSSHSLPNADLFAILECCNSL